MCRRARDGLICQNVAMSDEYWDSPVAERPDPFVAEGAADAVSLDSEIDYDDEQEDDQLPLDVVEAIEAGVMLDDPEAVDDDGSDDEGPA